MKFRLLKKCYQILFIPCGLLYRCRIIITEVFLSVFVLIFYCEMLHYNIVINQCSWPGLSLDKEDFSIPTTNENLLKVMVVTDLHMECSENVNGVIFDDELYMAHCFRTAVRYLKPDVVFVLGDVLDKEIQLCTSKGLNGTLRRFKRIFSVANGTHIFVLPENTDLEYQFQMNKNQFTHSMDVFHPSLVRFFTIKKNHFVLLNSRALEKNSSFIVSMVDEKLSTIETMLNCSIPHNRGNCDLNWTLPVYNRPILIQNFPLFRTEYEECDGNIFTPRSFKSHRLRKNLNCLGENVTDKILRKVHPRIVFSGHTHHGCTRLLAGGKCIEIMIPSFNWRAEKQPAIGLATVTTNNYEVIKCHMPRYSTIFTIYAVGCTFILMWIYYSYTTRRFSIIK